MMEELISREAALTMDGTGLTTGGVLPLATPGEFLRIEFLEPLGI